MLLLIAETLMIAGKFVLQKQLTEDVTSRRVATHVLPHTSTLHSSSHIFTSSHTTCSVYFSPFAGLDGRLTLCQCRDYYRDTCGNCTRVGGVEVTDGGGGGGGDTHGGQRLAAAACHQCLESRAGWQGCWYWSSVVIAVTCIPNIHMVTWGNTASRMNGV